MLKNIIKAIFISLIAFGAIFLSNIAVDPNFGSMSRDGGAFAYCGQQIDHGALLYRDCWDTKPPAIYYLDALVISIGGPTPWNLILAQAIWLSITCLVFYTILSRIWGNGVAFICTSLMLLTLLHPYYFSGGNLTETYALLPITLTLGAYWGYINTNKRLYLAGIGLFTAAAFLFKPTYISVGVAAGLMIAYRGVRQRNIFKLAGELGIILASFAVPLLLVAAYWWARHDLYDLVFAVFIHNQLYVQQGYSLRAFVGTLRLLVIEQPVAALSALAMISIALFAVETWYRSRRNDRINTSTMNPGPDHLWLMAGLTIATLIDVISTGLSGKNFHHYYQIPILTMAASSAYLFSRLKQARSTPARVEIDTLVRIFAIPVLLLPWVIEITGKEIPSRTNLTTFFTNPNVTIYQPNAIENFIIANTQPDQSILIWDYDPSIYLNVGRRSPTRYVFLQHLFTPMPHSPNGFAEFMQELDKDPPVFIISSKTSKQGLPYLGLSVDKICTDCSKSVKKGMIAFKNYVSQYYQPYTDIQQVWTVYKRIK